MIYTIFSFKNIFRMKIPKLQLYCDLIFMFRHVNHTRKEEGENINERKTKLMLSKKNHF